MYKFRVHSRFVLLYLLLLRVICAAQETEKKEDYSIRKDAIDIYYRIIRKKNAVRSDTVRKVPGKLYPSFFITPGYAVQSGFDINFSNVSAMYLSKSANISSVLTYISFTQKKQVIIPLLSNIFTKDNTWNFQGNWYYLKYPVSTFGLGNHTRDDEEVKLDFSTLRIDELFLRKAGKNLYAGIGYNLSKYWNITQVEKEENAYYDQYGFDTKPTSSGLQLCLQFDSRENSLNANNSSYLNATFTQNAKVLGSNTNWSSLMVDARHYIKFPATTNNVLAFWSYDVFTLTGKAPYLDLPANGWDEYSNSCRGYMEGRYRGLCMIDLETEYRIHFMKNDLIGAVVFGHLESYSTLPDRFNFNAVVPGGGVGLRVKVNKFSNTNLCLDYGFGLNGWRGFFFNLGEVF